SRLSGASSSESGEGPSPAATTWAAAGWDVFGGNQGGERGSRSGVTEKEGPGIILRTAFHHPRAPRGRPATGDQDGVFLRLLPNEELSLTEGANGSLVLVVDEDIDEVPGVVHHRQIVLDARLGGGGKPASPWGPGLGQRQGRSPASSRGTCAS